MLAQLIPVNGDSPITLTRDVTLVGRTEGLCDLVIDKKSISKLQCLIIKTDGLLFIRDLCSTNGTKVNGQKVKRGALFPGDELAFASIKYRIHLGPDRSEVSPSEPTEMLTALPDKLPRIEDFGSLSDSDSDVRLLDED